MYVKWIFRSVDEWFARWFLQSCTSVLSIVKLKKLSLETSIRTKKKKAKGGGGGGFMRKRYWGWEGSFKFLHLSDSAVE